MKVAGIILIILQVLALFGTIMGDGIGSLFSGGIAYMIGYFLPAIIGIILLNKASKKKAAEEESEQ